MLVGRHPLSDCQSPRYIASQTDGDTNIIVYCFRDRLGDTHHFEDSEAHTAPHQGPAYSHDWQVMKEAFQRGIAPGKANAVQENVTLAEQRDKSRIIQRR